MRGSLLITSFREKNDQTTVITKSQTKAKNGRSISHMGRIFPVLFL